MRVTSPYITAVFYNLKTNLHVKLSHFQCDVPKQCNAPNNSVE